MTITITKTRLAIAIVAVAMLIPATAVATHVFVDVADGKFYDPATKWAKDNDITTGSPAGSDTFKPDDPVTRGESVTFLKRYDDNIVQPALAAQPTVYTARVRGGFEHLHASPGSVQVPRTGEAGDAGPDHDHRGLGHAPRTPLQRFKRRPGSGPRCSREREHRRGCPDRRMRSGR